MRPIDSFDDAAEQYATATALRDANGTSLTFSELQSVSIRLASALTRITSAKPVPVAVLSPNDHRVLVCTLGIMRAGAVITAMHDRSGLERNLHYLRDVEPAVVFYHSRLNAEVRVLRASLTASVRWICIDTSSDGDPSLAQFMDGAPEYVDAWGDPFGNPTRPVYIRQTSGTTGTPKMIVGDIGSYHVTQSALQQKLRIDDCAAICLVATPLSHAAGVHAFAMLTLGATLVIIPDFDAVDVLRAIERHRITHLWLPASALYLLLDCPALGRTDCSSLRSVLLGASAVAAERLRESVKAFGPCVAVNYAQIEGGFLSWFDARTVADAAAGHHPERLASSGTTMGVGRLAVMDETGRLLPRGQTGEIVVRGLSVKPYIAKPYVRDEQELAMSHQHGWHHTGDLGRIAADGYLYIVGRKRDLVITGGFKVSVAEVERVIHELPEVGECVVVAVPDPVRGESVKAIVTVRPGRVITAKQILTHCRDRLGRVHSPVTVEQWTELPKNAGGKVDRQQIRTRFWISEDSDEDTRATSRGARAGSRGPTAQRAESNLV